METIAENICLIYDKLEGKQNRTKIFAHYRKIDESHLYPVLNKFNATNKAIKNLLKFEKDSGYFLTGLELCLFLDSELSNIINDPNL